MNHSFDVDVAARYGVDCAIMLANIEFWVVKNRANNRHFYDGKHWTYNSIKAWALLFPYWDVNKTRRILEKLESLGLIECGNFNQSGYDRTKWYTLSCQMHLANLPNGVGNSAKTLDKTDKKPDTAPAVVQSIKSVYKEVLPELKQERVSTDDRNKKVLAFWEWVMTSEKSDGTRRASNEEEALVWIRTYFERARQNDFIMGRSPKSESHQNWTADLYYLISERGRIQVIENT